MMRLPVLVASLVLAGALPAVADEVVSTATTEAPPAAAVEPELSTQPAQSRQSPEAIGAWARGVLAGEPAAKPAKAPAKSCETPPDRKPHGEVWGSVGTGGYRSAGGVVTQPVGKCGSVTVMMEHTEGNFGHGARRR